MLKTKVTNGVACLVFCCALASAERPVPVPTRADAVTDVLHGVKIVDPYRWLEDQDSPETRAWIESQAKVTRQYLKSIPSRDAIRGKLEALMQIEAVTAPVVRKGRYFFSRRRADQSRMSIWMRAGLSGRERLLVDPASIGTDEITTVSMAAISPDGTLLAYGVRKGSEDETDIRLLDVNTGRLLKDMLPRGRYPGLGITADRTGLYYARFIPRRGSRVYYHAMGTDPAQDKEIFGEGHGPDQIVAVELSDDGHYLEIGVVMGVPPKKVEVYVQDLKKGGPLRPVVNDIEAEFRPIIAADRMYLWTNWNAPNWRVLMADLDNPSRERWKEVVPEGPLPIDQVSAAAGRLFVSYLDNVVTRMKEFTPEGKLIGDFPLPGTGTAHAPSGEWEGRECFYGWNSFVSPEKILRYDVKTGRQDAWFEPKLPVDTTHMEVKQVWFTSKDRTRVPMFVLHRKGLALDGRRPAILYGYGGFSVSVTPAFSPRAAVWTEMGGVYAVANLRGGGEFGEKWHRAGMFGKKQNVFDDFIAAAEWLVANHYTDPRHLGIFGGSNGGLLVGAAMTQRPDLFAAVVCGAPLLDMLRYHKFKVGSWWTSEYGSAEDPKQFEYLRKYSPYHNVQKGVPYPAVLFVTGDSDTRVDPLHARKMTALVQASTASDNPVLLRYDTAGGHTGGTSVKRTIELMSDDLAFVAAQTGLQ